MHPLRVYLDSFEPRMTQQVFVEKMLAIGRDTSQQFISEIMSGKRHPSRGYARDIELATGGKVTAAELLLWEPAVAAPAAAALPTTEPTPV